MLLTPENALAYLMDCGLIAPDVVLEGDLMLVDASSRLNQPGLLCCSGTRSWPVAVIGPIALVNSLPTPDIIDFRHRNPAWRAPRHMAEGRISNLSTTP